MIARRRILSAATGACLLAILALSPLSSAKPVKAKFKTGTYVAKLDKVGGGFKFKVSGTPRRAGRPRARTASSR